MNKSKAGKLAQRLFTLLVLVACLMLVRGEPVTTAEGCTWQEANACLNEGGVWMFRCCICVDPSEPTPPCEEGFEWDHCTGRCQPSS